MPEEEAAYEEEWGWVKLVGRAGVVRSGFQQEREKLSALSLLPIEICNKTPNSARTIIKKSDFYYMGNSGLNRTALEKLFVKSKNKPRKTLDNNSLKWM